MYSGASDAIPFIAAGVSLGVTPTARPSNEGMTKS